MYCPNLNKLLEEFFKDHLVTNINELKNKTILYSEWRFIFFKDLSFSYIDLEEDTGISLLDSHSVIALYPPYYDRQSDFWLVFKNYLKENFPEQLNLFDEAYKKDKERFLEESREDNLKYVKSNLKSLKEKYPELEISFKL